MEHASLGLQLINCNSNILVIYTKIDATVVLDEYFLKVSRLSLDINQLTVYDRCKRRDSSIRPSRISS